MQVRQTRQVSWMSTPVRLMMDGSCRTGSGKASTTLISKAITFDRPSISLFIRLFPLKLLNRLTFDPVEAKFYRLFNCIYAKRSAGISELITINPRGYGHVIHITAPVATSWLPGWRLVQSVCALHENQVGTAAVVYVFNIVNRLSITVSVQRVA